jgi:hypothetical protein
MLQVKHLLAASAMVLLMSGPSFAAKPDMPPGQANKIARAVPGPVAGIGLPAAALIGGYIWWRRRSAAGQRKT